MSVAIGYLVLHAKRGGEPTGMSAYGPWRDSHVFIPHEVRDPAGPDWPVAKLEVNLPALGDWCWNWRLHFAPGDLVAVVSDHPKVADRQVLFCGFIVDANWTFDRNQHLIVTAAGMPYRLARDRDYLVIGRRMETKAGDIVSMTGLPCVFNAAGRPNRSVHTYTGIQGAPAEGVHVFTYDGDPDAEWWSVTDALEYLMWHYNQPQTWLTNHAFVTADFEATLSQSPATTDVEGMFLWQALAAVAEHGGYDLAGRTAADGDTFASSIRLTRRGAGTLQVLDHQPPVADGSFEVMDHDRTNLFAANIAETTASCITAPIVLGARPLYEITIELGKAWDPARLELSGGASIVTPGQEKANASNDYVKRYVTIGTDFAEYADVGRLWDANTDGFFASSPYNLTIPDLAALAGKTAGSWPEMPYKPHRLVSQIADRTGGAGLEFYVEFTVDGGTNWYMLGKRAARVMEGCLAVYLTAANLAEIYPDGGDQATDNLFKKLDDSPASVRLRLTCSVASPLRSGYVPARRSTAGTVFNQSECFDAAAAGVMRVRASSSRFYGTDVPAAETDDTARLAAFAAARQDVNEDRFVEASLTLEDIEPSVNLADRVERIGGIEVDLRTNAGAASRCPRVVCRTFRLAADTYQTELTLDTERMQPVL